MDTIEDPAIELFKIMLKRNEDPKVKAEIQTAIDKLEAEKHECST